MAEATVSLRKLAADAKQFARRLLTIGENRLELLAVEAQEERDRLLQAVLLALGLAAFGLLATCTLTAAIVVLAWSWCPVAVLLILAGLYMLAAFWLARRLNSLLHDRQAFSASLDQLKKDRVGLETILQ